MTPSQLFAATLELPIWLERCAAAGVPAIPGEVCPKPLRIRALISEQYRGVDAVSAWTEAAVGKLPGRGMWRWSVCAPISIKAAMSHPGLPVRVPWPDEALDDERFQAILMDCYGAGIETVTTVVRPWVEAAMVGGFPVEFRVFVTKSGATSTSSYYVQRALGAEWLPQAKEAARLAAALRPYVPAEVEYSADFLVREDGSVLFIEGGPMPAFGADPCCLAAEHPFGDGAIVLTPPVGAVPRQPAAYEPRPVGTLEEETGLQPLPAAQLVVAEVEAWLKTPLPEGLAGRLAAAVDSRFADWAPARRGLCMPAAAGRTALKQQLQNLLYHRLFEEAPELGLRLPRAYSQGEALE